MGKLIIINASPRSLKSNSKLYVDCFTQSYSGSTIEFYTQKNDYKDICTQLEDCTDLLFVFPLYADSIPVTLLNFLKYLEEYPLITKPTVHVIINCGFIEYQQNEVAIKTVKIFCRQNNFAFGSYLCIGSGEAIMTTPLAFMVKGKLKKLAQAIAQKRNLAFSVALPLSKKTFIKASTKFWIAYGAKNGITKEDMETMAIEENSNTIGCYYSQPL